MRAEENEPNGTERNEEERDGTKANRMMKSVLHSERMRFSLRMCSCCFVSTMWCFLSCLSANVRVVSPDIWHYGDKAEKLQQHVMAYLAMYVRV